MPSTEFKMVENSNDTISSSERSKTKFLLNAFAPREQIQLERTSKFYLDLDSTNQIDLKSIKQLTLKLEKTLEVELP